MTNAWSGAAADKRGMARHVTYGARTENLLNKFVSRVGVET